MKTAFALVATGAALLTLLVVSLTTAFHESDAAGQGITRALAFLTAIAAWILLGIAVLLCGKRGAFPGAAGPAAAVLFFAAAASVLAALDVLNDLPRGDRLEPLLRGIVGACPAVVLLFCLWSFFPALQAALPRTPARLAAAALLVLLSIIPWMVRGPARREARQRLEELSRRFQEARREDARRIAEMDALPADAPLAAYLSYTVAPPGRESDVPGTAIGRMSKLPQRQAQAEELLEAGDLRIFEALDRLELAMTPRLCAGARSCLHREAQSLRPGPHAASFDAAEPRINQAMQAVPWLLKNGCDARAEIGEVAAAVRLYPESYPRKWFLDYADGLGKEPR